MAHQTWTDRTCANSCYSLMQSQTGAHLRFAWILLFTLSLGVALSCGNQAVAQTGVSNDSVFGPNVYVIDPSATEATVEATLTSLANLQQFDTNRYAVLFKPGAYTIQNQTGAFGYVGYYESIAGLGSSPGDVTINGFLLPNQSTALGNSNETQTFWRSMENLTFNPTTSQEAFWGVSQGAALRRIQVNGQLELASPAFGFESGGFLADSRITGNVNIAGQQWFTRDSELGSWTGGGFNMVFSGVAGAPFPDFLGGDNSTVLPITNVSSEKPFLYLDQNGKYRVYVPPTRNNQSGVTWSERALDGGYSLPVGSDSFLIATPSTTLQVINQALAVGKSLILTPGIYKYDGPIHVTRPNSVVLGLGYATIVPQNGTAAITVDDVLGTRLAGLLIDAGPINSAVLLQVGSQGTKRSSGSNDYTVLNDIFLRIGGATLGTATTSIEIDRNNVILDNIWAWRADHGAGDQFPGPGFDPNSWTDTAADHGLVVNGDNVTALGLAVEHYEQNQVVWNGENGTTVFYQSELPYDVPNQAEWMNGASNGYASYSVSPSVLTHTAYGLGVYSLFFNNVTEDSAITVPNTEGVTITDALSWFIGDDGQITRVINQTGTPVNGGGQTSRVLFYQGVPCTRNCPAAPDTPLDLSAELVSPNQVNLRWGADRAPGVRYSVFRSLDPEFTPSTQNQLDSGLTEPDYTDTTVNPTATYYYSVVAVSDAGSSKPSDIASVTIPSSGGPIGADVLDINAGGGAIGSWVADEDVTGGTETSTGNTINTSLIPNPAPQAVYQTNRFGAFTYTIPGLTAGTKYVVDLHFAETFWTAPGQREFNVLINGNEVLKNFDILAAAGGQNIATVQSFLVTADSTGTITIQFEVGSADSPQINGIEIGTSCTTNCPTVPGVPTKLTAIVKSTN